MANPFSKGWKYLMASFDNKIDENADPKVQIQQAVTAAKQQHNQIMQQASQVIGQKKQLEMKLDRLVKDRDALQDKARQAIQLADKAAQDGDATKAQEFNNTAEVFASQLVSVEQQLEETTALHNQAEAAAEDATKKSKESEMRLKEQLSQIDALRAQADQAQMQETVTQSMDSLNQFGGNDDSVPTLDAVREKIERRYADALGAQELTQNSVNDRIAEIQQTGTDMRASARLEQIRAEAGLGSGAAGQLEKGTGESVEDAEELVDDTTEAPDTTGAPDTPDAPADGAENTDKK
ncbi:PspA/IM30 family protein [Corynebacterium gallinarum]|uniref:PspA/IM30 family protein n=1 Tax=Corynebacterium gallinarum TaxID=2762214 RepID=A0A8I0HN11_9CORY|nr:PspA/IM30 family protein [Corynebacterium gallinarum]MBD8029639.1 PspA/IM30 family protein [Corynebacterium gallinarum]NMB23668.1 PspA/IM30 family protein [Corynebacterium sp.]